MQILRLSVSSFIMGLLLAVAPLSAFAAETIFNTEYIGSSVNNVIKNEGQPDEKNKIALIYRHKVINGREFTVVYDLNGKTIDAVRYTDNDYKTLPVTEPAADWTWLTDMGATKPELIARWGQPHGYLHARKNFAEGRLTEEYSMAYHNVNLKGHLYSITYMFYKDTVIWITGQTDLPVSDDENKPYFDEVMTELTDIMDDPAWVHIINPRLRTFTYYLADEKYLASIDNIFGSQAFPRLSIMVLSHDTDCIGIYIGFPVMLSYWERDDVEKGGDYAKLVKVDQKIRAQLAEIEKNMPAEAKRAFLME